MAVMSNYLVSWCSSSDLVCSFNCPGELGGDLTLGGFPVSAAGSAEMFLPRRWVSKFISVSSAWIKAETHSFSDSKKGGEGCHKGSNYNVGWKHWICFFYPALRCERLITCFVGRHLCVSQFLQESWCSTTQFLSTCDTAACPGELLTEILAPES